MVVVNLNIYDFEQLFIASYVATQGSQPEMHWRVNDVVPIGEYQNKCHSH